MDDWFGWARGLFVLALLCALSEGLLPPGRGKRQFEGLCALLLFAGTLAPLGELIGGLPIREPTLALPVASAGFTEEADALFASQAQLRLEKLVRDKLAEAGIFPEGVAIDISVADEALTLGPTLVRVKAVQAKKTAELLRTLGLQTIIEAEK